MELTPEQRQEKIAEHIKAILELVGEDVTREGLLKTPLRAAKALTYLTQGYTQDPRQVMEKALFEYAGSKLIVVKDIEFYSMCEHHILPFFGTVTIGYIPGEIMLGLSKLARLVNVFARRLQVQERLTQQVCQSLMDTVGAKGVIVQCTARHLCMQMRGVEKQEAYTTTVEYCGLFENDPALRAEFFSAIR